MKKKLILFAFLFVFLFGCVLGLTTHHYSMLFNPIPNQAPYQVTPNGTDSAFFNPFAIKRVRFAMNQLFNREYIANELIEEWALPLFSYKGRDSAFGFLVDELGLQMGLSVTGNEEWAINEIDAALQEAATLPENQGKLEKVDQKWLFNGKQIKIRFLMRDDDQIRMNLQNYLATQLEKLGFSMEITYKMFNLAIPQVYNSDPRDFSWQVYLEGWGNGTRVPLDGNLITQIYAPWFGYLPGGNLSQPGNETWWKYEDALLDRQTRGLYYFYPLSDEEYLDLMMKFIEYGINESVRIYLVGYEKE